MKFILVSKLFTDYVLNSNSNYVSRSKCEFFVWVSFCLVSFCHRIAREIFKCGV